MGLDRRERLRAGEGSPSEWLADRYADLGHGAADLQAKAHEALRRGQDVVARTTTEAREFAQGASAGMLGRQPTTSQQPRRAAPSSHMRTSAQPRPRQSSNGPPKRDFGQQILDDAQRISAQAQQGLDRIANSGPEREVGGKLGLYAGNGVGLSDEDERR